MVHGPMTWGLRTFMQAKLIDQSLIRLNLLVEGVQSHYANKFNHLFSFLFYQNLNIA